MKNITTVVRRIAVGGCLTVGFLTMSCGGPSGVYQNSNGGVVLNLKSGGEATFSMMGESQPCKYTTESKKVTLTCGDEGAMVLTVLDDGSLAGPPGSPMGTLRKAKS